MAPRRDKDPEEQSLRKGKGKSAKNKDKSSSQQDVCCGPVRDGWLKVGLLGQADGATLTEGDFVYVGAWNAITFLFAMGLVVAESGGLRARPLFLNLYGTRDHEWLWPADSVALALGSAFIPVYVQLVAVARCSRAGTKPRALLTAMILSCLLTDAAVTVLQAQISGTNDFFTFILLLALHASGLVLLFRLTSAETALPALEGGDPSLVLDAIQPGVFYAVVAVLFTAPHLIVLVQRFHGPISTNGSDGACRFCYGIALVGSSASILVRNFWLLFAKYHSLSSLRSKKKGAESTSKLVSQREISEEEEDSEESTVFEHTLRRASRVWAALFGLLALALTVLVAIAGADEGTDAMKRIWSRVTWSSNGSKEMSERWPVALLLPVSALLAFTAFARSALSGDAARKLSNAIEQDTPYTWLPICAALSESALFVFTGIVSGLTDAFALALGALLILVTSAIFVNLGRTGPLVWGAMAWLLNSAPYALALSAFARHSYVHSSGKSLAALAYLLASVGLANSLLAFLAYGTRLRHTGATSHKAFVTFVRPAINLGAVLAAFLLATVGYGLTTEHEA
ncbi:MAG: hypothetical protein KF742_01730 [Cryobacterium sp.]|nr:hypothetical protein [Cryobacterium sp.]